MESGNQYLSELNDQQRAAVSYLDGPALVIAGAGSGKTRVLTYKIVHLLANGYEPWRIVALTFTNKAAREMRERIETLVGSATASKLWMGTFHSIFARILRINADRIGYKPSFTIYDAADSRSLIKTIIKEMGHDDKIYKPATVASSISMAKNALISPEQYAADRDLTEADRRARRPETVNIYRAYRQRCKVAGAMDFDDLLYYTNVLLRDNPDILRHYKEYFRYVLVDEYQDTNFAQHLIVSRLTEDTGNLCVVGDDAQSIYSFRGANISNILNLSKAYPRLSTFKLEQNYRSTGSIIDAANALIEKNTRQIPKQVFSTNPRGAKVELTRAYSDYEESYIVANRITQIKMSTHDSYSEMAILYRTNAQSRILEESLRKRNIPYRIYGGLSFYQRKEVKDAVSYMRLTLNPDDDEALRRIINTPARGIGETTVGKLTRAALDHRVSLWQVINDLKGYDVNVNRGTAGKLEAFASLVSSFIAYDNEGHDAYEVTRKIITDTRMLSLLMTDNTPESISRQENLQELLGGTKQFVDSRRENGEEDLSLGAFLSEVSLATDQDSDDTAGDDRVTLMTVHAAKGLEFSDVIVVGVEEELFPSSMSTGSLAEIEEERRLLYVAITRAKKRCMLTYATSRFRNGQTVSCSPSRFIKDIGPENLKMTGGTTVETDDTADHATAYTRPRVNPVANYHARERQASQNTSRPWLDRRPAPSAAQSRASVPEGMSLHAIGELSEGTRIHHSSFGVGVITKLDPRPEGDRVIVDFEMHGTKTVLLRFARFIIL